MKPILSSAFWVSFVIVVCLIGTALISPLYAVYASSWSLQPSQISLIYVVYMIGALLSLLCFGRLPDKLGYRPILAASLVLGFIGTVMTMSASTLAVLMPGRFIVGLAASFATTAGAIGLASVTPASKRGQLALLTNLLIAAGFGLGPLIGGLAGQWMPNPLFSAHIPTVIGSIIGLVAITFFVPKAPASVPQEAKRLSLGDLKPSLVLPPPGRRLLFLITCGSPFLAFGVFGLYAAMAPLFIDEILHLKGPLISGGSITVILLISCASQILLRKQSNMTCALLGLSSILLSNALLFINLSSQSALLFGLGLLAAAIGHGMCMFSGMTVINTIATAQNRAGLISTYLVIGYAGAILPTLAMGWIADVAGMDVAVMLFCLASGGLSIALLLANLIWAKRK